MEEPMEALKKFKDKVIAFAKKEVVLSIAFVAMIVTCQYVVDQPSLL